jgi:signal transduction histidine kinase
MGLLAYIRNWSLMVKIPVTVVGVVIILAAMLLIPIIYQVTSVEIENIEKRVNVFLDNVSDSLIPYIIREDYWAGFDFLKRSFDSQLDLRIRYVTVSDKNQRIFAGTYPGMSKILEPLPEKLKQHSNNGRGLLSIIFLSDLLLKRRITNNGNYFGDIYADIDLTQFKERLINLSITAIVFTTIISFFCGVIGYFISREMVRPLSVLGRHVEMVGRGEIEFIDEKTIPSNDEVSYLMVRFNQMAAALLENQKMAKSLAVKGQLAALGKLAASMAHEINNPLGGMLNVVNTLQRHGEDYTVRQNSLDLLARGIKQVQAIVQAALLMYRQDGDAETLRPVDLEDIRLLIQSDVKTSRIHLDWNNNIDHEIKIEPVAIRQVVLNLLLNGCEAMPSGGELFFEARAEEDHIHLVVDDNGSGMPPEFVDTLVNGILEVDEGPGGLGLWICQQLIQQLHGSWEIYSKLGAGTRIEVTFPLNQESGHAT